MNILDSMQNMSITSKNNKPKAGKKNISEPKVANYKPDIIDICSEKIVKKRDITDTVTIPRSLFKGYFCFTAGTTINSIAGMIKNNKVSNGLKIVGSLISIYGTFNFVKPFFIKEQNLTKTEK